jgi:hypothetical protein
MRGRIIHYNSNDGKGLISADNKQYPFEIAQWQSETAPSLNATVDFDSDGERPSAVRRVPDETLMKERAGELAGKIGAFGSAALQGAKGAAANSGVGNPLARFDKITLITHVVFVLGALFLPFVSITSDVGFSLVDIPSPIGDPRLVWLAILSVLLPMFWRNRLAWLALLIPLLAVVNLLRTENHLMNTVSFSSGMVVSLLAALFLALISIRHFLLPPSH